MICTPASVSCTFCGSPPGAPNTRRWPATPRCKEPRPAPSASAGAEGLCWSRASRSSPGRRSKASDEGWKSSERLPTFPHKTRSERRLLGLGRRLQACGQENLRRGEERPGVTASVRRKQAADQEEGKLLKHVSADEYVFLESAHGPLPTTFRQSA